MADPRLPDYLQELLARGDLADPAVARMPAFASTNAKDARVAVVRDAGPSVGAALEPDYGYGFRYNSHDPKGLGYLGTLKRPDGSGVMGEYSVGVTINGHDVEIPSMVPTLTRDEVQHILTMREGDRLPAAIQQKAVAHATQRLAAGLPVFARAGEQQNDRYPEIPRDAPIPRPQGPPLMPSHTTRDPYR